eukprot:TCALIF_05242-PA protein Name:"Similar to RAB40C Ras-related protein Rab-40C (Homo sapiens)" AED:0.06 eAED:0.06 QI:454/0.66/0.75/1/1/1/4/292/432
MQLVSEATLAVDSPVQADSASPSPTLRRDSPQAGLPLAPMASLRLTSASAAPPNLEAQSLPDKETGPCAWPARSSPDLDPRRDYPVDISPVNGRAVSGSAGSSRVNSDERLLCAGTSPDRVEAGRGLTQEDALPSLDLSPSLPSLPSLPSSVTLAQKSYDYLLKVLLVGDSDVGKPEILAGLPDGPTEWNQFYSSEGAVYKQTIILIDGKRVKLQLWDTSGQGRFCTIIRSYSRGAQGILLVYDITNKWSFEGIDRWLKEVDQHAPGIPKVLIGNRLHLEFQRQVDQREAELYAEKNAMGFFEVSPLADFNISESFVELARMALKRNGMERLWRSNKGKQAPWGSPMSSLYELCAHAIVNNTTVYGIDRLPLPDKICENLKSYALTNYSTFRPGSQYKSMKAKRHKQQKFFSSSPSDSSKGSCGASRKCIIS